MAEHQTGTSPSVEPAKTGSNNTVKLVVRIILFAILFYLICALPYDFYVARPGNQAAWDKIQTLVNKKNENPGHITTTNKTVQDTLQRTPSRTKLAEEGFTHEIYSWRGGLPWRTYDIYVTYYSKNGELLLENAYLNAPPEKNVFTEDDVKTSPQDPNAKGPIAPAGVVTGGGPSGRPTSAPDSGQAPSRPDAEDATKNPAPEPGTNRSDAEGESKKPDAAGAAKDP